jgi:hypothetical protein
VRDLGRYHKRGGSLPQLTGLGDYAHCYAIVVELSSVYIFTYAIHWHCARYVQLILQQKMASEGNGDLGTDVAVDLLRQVSCIRHGLSVCNTSLCTAMAIVFLVRAEASK